MGLLTAAASLKLGQSALKLAGAAIKAAHKGELADLFELGSGAVEFAGGLTEAQRVTVTTITARIQKRLERGYQEMLEREGAGWALRADVTAVFLRLPDVLEAAQPDARAIVAANLDTARIAALVADKAGRADGLFADDQIGRRILIDLVTAAYEEVKQDEQFGKALSPVIYGELLRRTEEIATKSDIDNIHGQLGQILSRIGTEVGIPMAVLNEILARFGESGNELDAAQIEERLRAKAKEYYELRERLSRLTDDDPRVQALRREAAGWIDKGDFDEADAKLSEAENVDLIAIRELEGVADRRRASAAATRAERGAAAGLRLDYIAAAEHFAEAASLVMRDDAAVWAYRMRQASALLRRGDELGDNAALHRAIAAYRDALRLVSGRPKTSKGLALERAMTQNDMGSALCALGERESGTVRLEEAVAAYRIALQELTRERLPLLWATMQNNLGNVLCLLGSREGGRTRLVQAVAAYHAALQERTRERVPLDWAVTQNNLGNALGRLGERESGTARLEEAVAAYRGALAERTRERAPLGWAVTQSNLGTVLMTLGARQSGKGRLREAVAAYRDALHELTRERLPLQWAATKNNLGAALQELGGREMGTTRLLEAVAAYCDALQEWTRERAPLKWATAQNNLGNVLQTLGARENGTARLEEAVTAYRMALLEKTRERVPLEWAAIYNNLGSALRVLGSREKDLARLEEAVLAFRTALLERTRERVPLDWASTQRNLGIALWWVGMRTGCTDQLIEAVKAWDGCLSVVASVWPADWIENVRLGRKEALAEIARRRALGQAS